MTHVCVHICAIAVWKDTFISSNKSVKLQPGSLLFLISGGGITVIPPCLPSDSPQPKLSQKTLESSKAMIPRSPVDTLGYTFIPLQLEGAAV